MRGRDTCGIRATGATWCAVACAAPVVRGRGRIRGRDRVRVRVRARVRGGGRVSVRVRVLVRARARARVWVAKGTTVVSAAPMGATSAGGKT